MKPTHSITLFSISLLFFIGVFKYYSTHQKDMAKVLFRTSNSTNLINASIKNVNERSIRRFEYSKYSGEADDFKPFYKKLVTIDKAGRDLQKSIRDFNSELSNLENPFYIINENDRIKFTEATFIFPFNQNKKIDTIIQKNATILHNAHSNLIKKVENTLTDTSLFNPTNSQYLKILKQENLTVLDSFKHQMKVLESVETTQKHCSQFDFLRLQLQLSLFEQHYLIFENAIIDNFSKIKFELQNAEINNQNYAFTIYGRNEPIIGKNYDLQLFLINYVINETIEMRVNGQPISVKDGIGYYKNKKGNRFLVDISLMNIMTNRRDSYSNRFD